MVIAKLARKWAALGAFALLIGSGAARAEHELDWTDIDTDGQTIGTSTGDVRVGYNVHSPITAFADGGTQVDGIVYLFHNASLAMAGGSVGYEVDAMDRSTVTVSGGSIEYGIVARDQAAAEVSGGEIGGLTALGQGSVSLSGGLLHGYFDTFDRSTGDITGGNILLDVSAYFDSAILIRGGAIGGNVLVRGDAAVYLLGGSIGGQIVSFGNGAVNVFGYGLSLSNPTPAWGGTRYDLTGTLADGTPLSHTAYVMETGRINLVDVASLPAGVPLPGLLMGGVVPPPGLVWP